MVEQGFSSADPSKARGYQGVIIKGKRVSSGSSSRRRASSPSVNVSGDTVFINGQGFSVAPELQESFIRNRVGSSNSSANQAIQQVQENLKKQAEEKARRELQFQREQDKLLEEQRRLQAAAAKLKEDAKIQKRLAEEARKNNNISEARQLEEGRKRNLQNANILENTIIDIEGRKSYNRKKPQRSKVKTGTVTISEPPNLMTRTAQDLLTKAQRDRLTKKDRALLLGLGFLTVGVDTAKALVQLPSTTKEFIKNPSLVKKLPGAIREGLIEAKNVALLSPEYGLGRIAGEIAVAVAGNEGFKAVGKLTKKGANFIKRNRPDVIDIVNGKVIIKKAGKVVGTQDDLTLKIGTIEDTAESAAKQAGRGGKRATAVTAQAEKRLGFIKRKDTVLKPLPLDEARLTRRTRQLLENFRKKKLSDEQIIDLNKRLRKETKRLGVQKKGIDLLETSLYFDPDRTIRASRFQIGQQAEEATLRDFFRGDAKLFEFKKRPAVYVIDEYIELLPNTKAFRSIKRKLRNSRVKGKDPNLTRDELALLTKWQVTPSGKLKNIGSTTYSGGLEREVTIAPNEVIKKVKTLAKFRYKDEIIPVYAIKILKGNTKKKLFTKLRSLQDDLADLLKKRRSLKTKSAKDKVTKKIEKVKSKLKKAKSRKVAKEIQNFQKDVRRARKSKKVLVSKRRLKKAGRVARKGVTRGARVARKAVRKPVRRTPTKRVTRKPGRVVRPDPRPPKRPDPRPPKRPDPRPPKRPDPRPPKRPDPRPPKRPDPRPPKRPVPRPPVVILPKSQRGFAVKKLRKSVPVYYVVKKQGKRLVKLQASPLRLEDAKDYLAYTLDNKKQRTAFYVPAGQSKNVVTIPGYMKGYARKISKKLRPYKIKQRKKKALLRGFIEKRKYAFDKKSERSSVRRKKRSMPTKKKKKKGTKK